MASFGEAFKSARSAGKKTFKWQGKTYHTKTKEEMEKKTAPAPQSKPSSGKAKEDEASAKPVQSLKIGSRLMGAAHDYPRDALRLQGKVTDVDRLDARTANAPRKNNQEMKDYPRPMKQVGIARPGSLISKEAARRENTPHLKWNSLEHRAAALEDERKRRIKAAEDRKKPRKPTPTPTGRSDRSY